MGQHAGGAWHRPQSLGRGLEIGGVEVEEDHGSACADPHCQSSGVAAKPGGAVDDGLAGLGAEEVDGFTKQNRYVGCVSQLQQPLRHRHAEGECRAAANFGLNLYRRAQQPRGLTGDGQAQAEAALTGEGGFDMLRC